MKYALFFLCFVMLCSFGKCKREEQQQARGDFQVEGVFMGNPVSLKGKFDSEKKILSVSSYQPPAFITAAAGTLGFSSLLGAAGLGGTGLFGLLSLWLAKRGSTIKGAFDQVVSGVQTFMEKNKEKEEPLLTHLSENMSDAAKAEVKKAKKRKASKASTLQEKA